ncbi:META domain-containing protein [Actinotalea sp. K2]|uniref:META domain-containing protein n=1 Tax=Actinotalea sp. K2 TaxID=2939438 RepID=UPI0020174C9A|nr:META domain-containing protein [Actinotalea sp. K2]MCL3861900.1 META domain-containing protein [Actinotalea sp. K2]
MDEVRVRDRSLRAVPVMLMGLAMGLSACGGGSAVGGADLEGRTFVSTDVAGYELVEGTAVQVIFQSDRISVHAGCNTLNGGATWEGDVLRVAEPMAQTMMACGDDLSRQDDWLEAFLMSEPALRLDGSTLVLGDSTEGLTLEEQ